MADCRVEYFPNVKELDQYRTAIVYMTYEVGMGRIAFSNNDLLTAQAHFKNASEAGKSALPMIANLGQTRRFRAAARTSLADVVWRQPPCDGDDDD